MRYLATEGQWVIASFDTRDTVTIALKDLNDDSAVAVDDNSCSEIDTDGTFKWNTSNITSQPGGLKQYKWRMTSAETSLYQEGKIVLNGWPLTADGAAALASYDPPTKAELDAAVASLATQADIRELRRGNLLMELTAATNIDSVRKVAVGCLDYITYKTKADGASDWTSPTSTKVLYAWYTVLGSKNPWKMGEDG